MWINFIYFTLNFKTKSKMKVVIQRVTRASVTIEQQLFSSICKGMLIWWYRWRYQLACFQNCKSPHLWWREWSHEQIHFRHRWWNPYRQPVHSHGSNQKRQSPLVHRCRPSCHLRPVIWEICLNPKPRASQRNPNRTVRCRHEGRINEWWTRHNHHRQ